RVGEIRPPLLAAIEVQPVGGADEESRALVLVDDVARCRVHVERSMLEEDLELVAFAVDLSWLVADAELLEHQLFRRGVVRWQRSAELVRRRRPLEVRVPLRDVVHREAADGVDEGQSDGRVAQIAVNGAQYGAPPIPRARALRARITHSAP